MRRWIWIVGTLVIIGLACWAWPLIGAAQLAHAVQSENSADFIDRVDTDRLRRSLARQIATAYLDATGRGKKMGSFGRSIAGAAVTTVADPYVAELLTPENLTALLAHGRVNQVKLGQQTVAIKGEIPTFAGLLNGNWLSLVADSYFDQITDFVIPVDGGHGVDDQFGVHMHLDGVTWKLGGLDLPATLVDEMARSILAGEKPPA